MYRYAFPPCQAEGSLEPVPFGHLVLHGAVPAKCKSCNHLFEGSCTRALDSVKDYQQLDHGPCPVIGPTNPVEVSGKEPPRPLFMPSKCISCPHLTADSIRGYVCGYESEKWGQFPRTLDWGGWRPKHVPLGLGAPVIATEDLISYVAAGATASAVKELKRLYPGIPTASAISAVNWLCAEINGHGDNAS